MVQGVYSSKCAYNYEKGYKKYQPEGTQRVLTHAVLLLTLTFDLLTPKPKHL